MSRTKRRGLPPLDVHPLTRARDAAPFGADSVVRRRGRFTLPTGGELVIEFPGTASLVDVVRALVNAAEILSKEGLDAKASADLGANRDARAVDVAMGKVPL